MCSRKLINPIKQSFMLAFLGLFKWVKKKKKHPGFFGRIGG